jgi:GNAT superfamily N-acetyltransferase
MAAVDDLARQRAATFGFWRADVAVRPGGEWMDLDGVYLHTTGLEPRHWNGAHVTRSMDLEPIVPLVAAWFRERGKRWGLLVPAELELTPPGLTHLTDQRVMLRRLDAIPELPLPGRISVTDRAPTVDVAQVQSEAFGEPYDVTLAFLRPTLGPHAAPPQQTVVAYDVHEPVGCATFARQDGVAGIYGVGVREKWRRRGIGAALTAMCLKRAAAAGCDLAYLNPSDSGYGVYASLGFVDAPPMRVWVPD